MLSAGPLPGGLAPSSASSCSSTSLPAVTIGPARREVEVGGWGAFVWVLIGSLPEKPEAHPPLGVRPFVMPCDPCVLLRLLGGSALPGPYVSLPAA